VVRQALEANVQGDKQKTLSHDSTPQGESGCSALPNELISATMPKSQFFWRSFVNKPSLKDTWQDWAWWLLWGLIIAACVSYPLRYLLNPDFWRQLNWWQEILLLIVTVVGTAVFVVRPFCKNMAEHQ